MQNDYNDPVLRSINREMAMLQDQIRTLEEAAAQRKHALMAIETTTDEVIDRPIRQGQYTGLKITDALKNYLAERGGGPIQLDRIVVDLAVAGVDLGPPNRHHWNVKIAMSAGGNRNLFNHDKAANTVSLVRGPAIPKPSRKAH